MKPRPFDYVRPDTVEEVLALLAEYGDDARILAGGQSLVPMLNLRLIDASVLIDISRIAALDVIRDLGRHVEIGAAVTQNRLMAWPQLAKKLPLLAAALPFVGHFQTRNKGTVCGSIAHADPSSEIPLALAVLGGEVVLRSKKRGERVLRRQRVSEGHADDGARAGRTDRRRAISGHGRAGRRLPRSGAAARRLRHHRGRGRGRQSRRCAARRRRHGRPAAGAPDLQRSGAAAISGLGARSSRATRICTPRRRCGATCSKISLPM